MSRRPGWFAAACTAALAVVLVFLGLPVAAIFVSQPPARLISSLGDPEATDALRLSLECSAIALGLIVAVGTPAAYLLATRNFRGRDLAITVIELPLVMPPAVAGVALLAAVGPQGIIGGLGDQLVFQTAGVVVALMFVSSPFYLRQAQSAFAAVDVTWLEASRTLGAGPGRTFMQVAVPAAAPGLGAGMALAWGRSLGEFGATILFAGNLRGVTETAPLAIYNLFAEDFPAAVALSAVLIALSAAVLLGVRLFLRPAAERRHARA